MGRREGTALDRSHRDSDGQVFEVRQMMRRCRYPYLMITSIFTLKVGQKVKFLDPLTGFFSDGRIVAIDSKGVEVRYRTSSWSDPK